MDQPTVVIISDDAEFSRLISGRWQTERIVPALRVMSADLGPGFDPDLFDLAIVGPAVADAVRPLLEVLDRTGRPVILVSDCAATAWSVRAELPRILVVRQYEAWTDTLVLLATEALRRAEAVARAQRAEESNSILRRHAVLGQYVLDMRHSMNNALTSVLGNSELLLLEPGGLAPEARAQIDTIRHMALRLHEILQRFSSLEKEMTVVQSEVRREPRARAAVG
ncbi:MAG TPA: histidine kinase dimerization/phospho-acceptor domain-containing protein [Terriglobales bacterium]|nr:histidine kinase dimerization/phospho-acceptor domain-containing protein [Terriglobales bacterium]